MNAKPQKLFLIVSSSLMLIATFLYWFVSEPAYQASMSVRMPGMGNISYGASTSSIGISGIVLTHGQVAAVVSVIALILAFTRLRYGFAAGVLALLIGCYTALISDVEFHDVSIRKNAGIGLGLYLFLLGSLVYTVIGVLPFLKNKKNNSPSNEADTEPEEIQQSATRFRINKSPKTTQYALIGVASVAVVIAIGAIMYARNNKTESSVPVDAQINLEKKSHNEAGEQTDKGEIAYEEQQNQMGNSSSVNRDGVQPHAENEQPNFDDQPVAPVSDGKYPQGSDRPFFEDELSRYSKTELKLMRNEIYARNGYIFSDSTLNAYFRKQPWYQPRYNDVSSYLTDIEKDNINQIKHWE